MATTLLVAFILITLTATQIVIIYSFGSTTAKISSRVQKLERSQTTLATNINRTADSLRHTARKLYTRTPSVIEGNMDLIANDRKATVDVVFRTKQQR